MFRRITERRKQEDDAREQNRLPPGQSLTQKFPVLHYGTVPPSIPTPGIFAFLAWLRKKKCGTGRNSTNYHAHR